MLSSNCYFQLYFLVGDVHMHTKCPSSRVRVEAERPGMVCLLTSSQHSDLKSKRKGRALSPLRLRTWPGMRELTISLVQSFSFYHAIRLETMHICFARSFQSGEPILLAACWLTIATPALLKLVTGWLAGCGLMAPKRQETA